MSPHTCIHLGMSKNLFTSWNVQEPVCPGPRRAQHTSGSGSSAAEALNFPFPFHLLHRACGSALISMATAVESLTDRLAKTSIKDSAAGHVWVDTPRGLATALDDIRAADIYAFDCEGVDLGRWTLSISIGQQPKFSSWAQGSANKANIYGNFTTGKMHYTALADDVSRFLKLVNIKHYQGNKSKNKIQCN